VEAKADGTMARAGLLTTRRGVDKSTAIIRKRAQGSVKGLSADEID